MLSRVLGMGVVRGVIVGVLALLASLLLGGHFAAALALALPEGRVYELVSPVYKGGYGVNKIEAVAPDGDSAAFYSPGTFAGAPQGLAGQTELAYLAKREPSGWSTESLLPPAELTPYPLGQDVSSTLNTTFDLGVLGPNDEAADQDGVQEEFLFHSVGLPDTAANWEVAGGVLETQKKKHIKLTYYGASADLCHLLFRSTSQEENLLPGATGKYTLYELDRGCEGEAPSVRLVAVNNQDKSISPSCPDDLGIEEYAGEYKISHFNDVSAGGREVFFTTSVGKGECDTSLAQLFVRLDGSRTLEVSRPLEPACGEVPCGGAAVAAARTRAAFVGASSDGSKVFFETTAPLTTEDRDADNDLYMARIGCPSGAGEACEPGETEETKVTSLVLVSHDPHAGEAAEVQGAVRIAPDGTRAYFVARGELSGPNAEGQAPVRGADNLYVYDSATGVTAFVADLCSGPGLSGVVEDPRCPTESGRRHGRPTLVDGECYRRSDRRLGREVPGFLEYRAAGRERYGHGEGCVSV